MSQDTFPSQEEIARDVCFKLSFVKREYEGIVTNVCDISDAFSKDKKKFRELEYGTPEFYRMARSIGNTTTVDRDGTCLILDRAWVIIGHDLDENTVLGFYSAKTEDLISIADEGFDPQTEVMQENNVEYGNGQLYSTTNTFSTTKQRYTRIIDSCQVAMAKTSDDLATCIVVGISLDPTKRVFTPSDGEGYYPLGAFARSGCESAHYYDPELCGYARFIPCNKAVPLYFMLFRKVRSSSLWLGISNTEFNTTEKPVIDSIPLKDTANALSFLRTLVQNTKKLWNVEDKEHKAVVMKRKVFLKTADFICVSTTHPEFEVDFTACPRTQCNWDTLCSSVDISIILTLYTFATYVKTLLEKLLGMHMEIMFPLNPGDWQLHCRIVCAKKMRPRTNGMKRKFLSVEKVISDVAEGRLCKGYNTIQRIDTKNMPPPPASCDILSTRQCEISSDGINVTMCEHFSQQYPVAFNQYWFGEDPL